MCFRCELLIYFIKKNLFNPFVNDPGTYIKRNPKVLYYTVQRDVDILPDDKTNSQGIT